MDPPSHFHRTVPFDSVGVPLSPHGRKRSLQRHGNSTPAVPRAPITGETLLTLVSFRMCSGTNEHATRQQVLNSFGLGYRLVGTEEFKQRTLIGAQTLYVNRYEVRRWQPSCFPSLKARLFYKMDEKS